jgi:bacterioferritin-associated ferredoxin
MNASPTRTWTDEQLRQAVSASNSWRGVRRALGLSGTSATAIRIARRHANRLGLDVSHIRGRRRWSDDQLRQAVSESSTWEEVRARLGLSTDGGAPPHIKANAIRLGLDTSHLNRLSHLGSQPSLVRAEISDRRADLKYLRVAAACGRAGVGLTGRTRATFVPR